jgi:hypothetical protein
MPDHMHVMFMPCGISLERRMQFVKGGCRFALQHSNVRGRFQPYRQCALRTAALAAEGIAGFQFREERRIGTKVD